MADEPFEDVDNVRSITDRATSGEEEQEEFPLGLFEPEDRKTLKTLIRSGLPVEMTVSMRSAEVPLRGGLPDPDKAHRFLMTSVVSKVEEVAQREGEDDAVTGWKVRVTLRPTYVEAISTAEPVAAEG
jgi:hypothetical protein